MRGWGIKQVFIPCLSFIFIINGDELNPVEIITNFVSDANRIFTVSKKPTMEEYKRMTAIVGLGIVVIGIIAFVLYILFILLKIS
jgi:protein translocase SEC61 complex gamma subunit